MKTILLSFIVFYTIVTSPIQIKGKILCESNNDALPGVMIVVNEKDTTYSDFDGNFIISNIDSIKKIKLIYPSYDSNNLTIIRLSENDLASKK